ncbi:MAG: MoaD/ThiS family protein [Epsilonproteobacteria bacterium]|nr:MoaD/ThiS family protein [Campylobacterota bacterium]
MAIVEFLGPMAREAMSVDVNSLRELKEYFKDDEELQKWLKICAVSVNDKIVKDLDTPLSKEDKVSLLPPVCGG